jgi:hypothetical protein
MNIKSRRMIFFDFSIQQACQELNLIQPMQMAAQLARPFIIRDDDLAA